MAAANAPVVRQSQLQVPAGPGLGLDLNWDFLKANLAPGEEFWG
jgi:L-alanine-DL-glutamate epimerase-like enolase superfamily enzyme